ncbi:hypothetical protein CVT26_008077 [Gymnopilus dilepis]|uniref:HRDC domain-containing protein n=1 Tax=Gymnopilus dilepis TaxID=231916 RepID=A0A409YJS1_9AGAR|nr:hypothetical protein CVT26_008077 [Gymnopilus dilepis]
MQWEVYKSVHWWREKAAREEDESTRYILQNHVLFLVAEQPPSDMAALLALFESSIPPVVKRRAKELLTVIEDAVKRGMAMARVGGSQMELAEDGTAMVESTATTTTTTAVVESRKDVVMLDKEMKDLEKVEVVESVKEVESTSIWGRGIANALSTPQSSLFGVSVSKVATTMSKTPALTASNVASGGPSTSVSTLFGIRTKSVVYMPFPNLSNTAITHAVHPRFEELVAKIDRSLTMTPLFKIVSATAPQPQVVIEEIPSLRLTEVPLKYVQAQLSHAVGLDSNPELFRCALRHCLGDHLHLHYVLIMRKSDIWTSFVESRLKEQYRLKIFALNAILKGVSMKTV